MKIVITVRHELSEETWKKIGEIMNATEQAIVDRLNALPAKVVAAIAAAQPSDSPEFITALQGGLTTLESTVDPTGGVTPPA